MVAATQPQLEPGRIYRTQDLARWSMNPPRLARRLVNEGKLVPLAQGLFVCPKRSRFGLVPPEDAELMRGFLKETSFVFTGSDRWNALGLGSTAVLSMPIVYNRKRTGTFEFGGRKFMLRRVAFPENPTPEWFIVDLFENAKLVGASPADLAEGLKRALGQGKFDRDRLSEMATQYGTKATQSLISSALQAVPA